MNENETLSNNDNDGCLDEVSETVHLNEDENDT